MTSTTILDMVREQAKEIEIMAQSEMDTVVAQAPPVQSVTTRWMWVPGPGHGKETSTHSHTEHDSVDLKKTGHDKLIARWWSSERRPHLAQVN